MPTTCRSRLRRPDGRRDHREAAEPVADRPRQGRRLRAQEPEPHDGAQPDQPPCGARSRGRDTTSRPSSAIEKVARGTDDEAELKTVRNYERTHKNRTARPRHRARAGQHRGRQGRARCGAPPQLTGARRRPPFRRGPASVTSGPGRPARAPRGHRRGRRPGGSGPAVRITPAAGERPAWSMNRSTAHRPGYRSHRRTAPRPRHALDDRHVGRPAQDSFEPSHDHRPAVAIGCRHRNLLADEAQQRAPASRRSRAPPSCTSIPERPGRPSAGFSPAEVATLGSRRLARPVTAPVRAGGR